MTIFGGDHPHIGSITTLTRNLTPKTFNFPSHSGRFHKDHYISQKVAQILSSALPGTCTITAGFHIDHISKKQIQTSILLSVKLAKQIKNWLKSQDLKVSKPIYYSDKEKPK